jgi:hypothetical protein
MAFRELTGGLLGYMIVLEGIRGCFHRRGTRHAPARSRGQIAKEGQQLKRKRRLTEATV